MSDHDTPHRKPQDPEALRRYLLGRLSHEESDALEPHLLHDGRLFELAEATEDELIDRYVRGELPSDDAKRFERHLLPSRRIRERVDVARALAAWADRERPESGGVVVPMVGRFRRTAHLAWAAALVAAIAVGTLSFEVSRLHDRLDDAGTAGGVEQARGVEEVPVPVAPEVTPAEEPATVPDEQVEDLELELAAARDRIASLAGELEQRPTDRAIEDGAADIVSTATLVLGLATRGVTDEKSLVLEEAERAEIYLDLGGRRPATATRATVTRNGTVIWDDPAVEVRTEEGVSMARLVLDSKSLAEGRYQIRLVEQGREQEAKTYPFSVER